MATRYKITEDLYISYEMTYTRSQPSAMILCHNAAGDSIPWPANVVIQCMYDGRELKPVIGRCFLIWYDNYMLKVDGKNRLSFGHELQHDVRILGPATATTHFQ